MSFQTQTKMVCDRCGQLEVVDTYPGDDPRWTRLVAHTFKTWLFSRETISCSGNHIEQTKWLCPKCTAEFVSWMQPGRLKALQDGLIVLISGLRAHIDVNASSKHKTKASAASAETLSLIIERLNKLLG